MKNSKLGLFIFSLIFLLLLLPNFMVIYGSIRNSSSFGMPSNFNIGFFIVIVFEIFLLSILARPWLWLTVNFLFMLLLPFESLYIYRYGDPSGLNVLSVVSETNIDEALGYVGDQFFVLTLGFSLWAIFIIFLVFFLYDNIAPWFHRTRYWTAIVLFGALLVFFLQPYSNSSPKGSVAPDKVGCLTGECRQSLALRAIYNTYPLGIPLRILDFTQQDQVLSKYSKYLKNNKVKLDRDIKADQLEETYIVIIGESSRADKWAIFGYDKETTPNISKRNDIVAFSNVVAGTVMTRLSVPLLLSGTKVTDLASLNFKASWISTFQDAGFHVSWLSMQQPVGSHDTTIGMYAELADEVKYFNYGTYNGAKFFDGDLLLPINKLLRSKYKKRLIILHNLGSHLPYENRYPASFEYFKPSLTSYSGSYSKNALINNTYDNTIRYTDWFINKIIIRLEKLSGVSALWYISDHGQTLPSDGCKYSGNGFISKPNLVIPMIFWHNDLYKKTFPKKLKFMASKANIPIHSEGFGSALLDSFGFKLDSDYLKHSFLSESYSSETRSVTVDGLKIFNFDEIVWSGACVATDK